MGREKSILKQLQEFKKEAGRHIPIRRMILFGSYAHGKPGKWSDIDLIMVSPSFRGQKPYTRGVEFYRYWQLNCPVDFLCYTPEEFERLAKQITIVSQALKEGIEIG